jgi:hypothetical protein
MKTAVSIPDKIFEKAEHFARRSKQSRSQLYSKALEEYINRHAPDRVTEEMIERVRRLGPDLIPLSPAPLLIFWSKASGDFSRRYLVGRSPKPKWIRTGIPPTCCYCSGGFHKSEPDSHCCLYSADKQSQMG